MKHYFWIAYHNEGVQDYGLVSGKNVTDALANQLRKDSSASIWSLDDFEEEVGDLAPQMLTKEGRNTIPQEFFMRIAEKIYERIKRSAVNGDSDSRIDIFDVTDLSNITLVTK